MFFSLDQQPYSLQLHPSDSQVYIEFAVFLNTTSNNRAPLQCTKHFLRFIDEYLWGQLTFTVPWKELQSTKFNWLTFKKSPNWSFAEKGMENIIKKYISEEVPSLSPASVCFPLSLWFSSCRFYCLLFLFFSGLHTLSILNVTLMQVPCTFMFLKIQTQVFKHMLHNPIHL